MQTIRKIDVLNDVVKLHPVLRIHVSDDTGSLPRRRRRTIGAASHEDLPDDWAQRPPGAASRDFRTDWLGSERSPALQVPSALFPTEAYNYVLNPAPPAFDAAVEVDDSEPLRLDPRIEARLAKDSS